MSKELSNKRCLNEENEEWFWDDKKCPTKCSYHKDNNTEIHHKDLSKHAKTTKMLISKGWLEFLNCNNHENKELVYFNILYLDLEKIDLKNFGDDETMVYNRFFRTVITGTLNYFCLKNNKNINQINIKIFHDKADEKEMHEYFPWHLFYKLIENIPKVTCEKDHIKFLDSDHKKKIMILT